MSAPRNGDVIVVNRGALIFDQPADWAQQVDRRLPGAGGPVTIVDVGVMP